MAKQSSVRLYKSMECHNYHTLLTSPKMLRSFIICTFFIIATTILYLRLAISEFVEVNIGRSKLSVEKENNGRLFNASRNGIPFTSLKLATLQSLDLYPTYCQCKATSNT